jgi:hypothetical protein
MRIVVTRVAGDGSVRRGILDTAERGDASRWEDLVDQAAHGAPPPYRPVSGMPVYEIRAGEDAIMIAEGDLTGPLRELVITALTV